MMRIEVSLCLLFAAVISGLADETEDGCYLDPRKKGPPKITNPDGPFVLESATGRRRKRDVPWCPEAEWEVTGRSDGCMAVPSISWFKCTTDTCLNLPPPADGTIRKCKQDKYTSLMVNLNCSDGAGGYHDDWMVVVRPQACSCYKISCQKYHGPMDD